MLIFLALLSLVLVLAIARWSLATGGRLAGVLNPVVYLAGIWFVSYPLRSVLIHHRLVDTQAIGFWSERNLALSVVVAAAVLGAIWLGARSATSGSGSYIDERERSPASPGPSRRLLGVSATTAFVSLVSVMQLSIEDGRFQLFQQNAMLELRPGSGPVFLLAEIATYGAVALLGGLVAAGRVVRRRAVAAALALHVIVATVVMIGLSTRRPIGALLVGGAIVAIVRFRRLRSGILAAIVLAASVGGAPALDALRYSCIPCIFGMETETRAAIWGTTESALNAIHLQLRDVLQENAGSAELSAEDRRRVLGLRRRWESDSQLADSGGTMGGGSQGFARSALRKVAAEPSPGQREAVDLFAQADPMSRDLQAWRVPLTLLSSTFEGADHVGTFLQRASPAEFVLGVDQGRAWVYNAAASLIPRQIWKDKPLVYGSVAEQRYLYPYMFEATATPTTLPPGFVVDFMFGFGFFVALLLAYGLGRLLAVLWRRLWCQRSVPATTLSLFTLMYTFNLVRSGTAFVQSAMILLFVVALAAGVRATLTDVGGAVAAVFGQGGGEADATDRRVFFYPHGYLRRRQLDTVKRWPAPAVANREAFLTREHQDVDEEQARAGEIPIPWWRRLPLPNVKRRPRSAPAGSLVYVWGGVTASGPFIVDLDNPYALVGYNLRAMGWWRWLIRRVLLSERCREIRCLSEACRATLAAEFGESVAARASVVYPCVPAVAPVRDRHRGPALLFVGTQFEMKGGESLLRAFPLVRAAVPATTLDIVTHLPEHLNDLARQPGVTVHAATFTPEELEDRFFRVSDVLVHPTFVESFGMVVLEALANGMAVIATDVYAIREMVEDGSNGLLLDPPVSVWDGVMPSALYYQLHQAVDVIRETDRSGFETDLATAIIELIEDPVRLGVAQVASRRLHETRFPC